MEPTTFTGIYERYAPDVLRFAWYWTARRDLAEEITSETFLRAWMVRDRVSASTLKSYLLSIARHLITDRYRRERREAPLVADFATPDARPEAVRYLDQTMAALHELPEIYRLPLILHAINELPYDEIARTLDLPLSTVKIRIHRARLQLHERLTTPREPNHELVG
jgi:RNA polymerase sigma-70 factor (ECF subfamily)